jgi:hypothetical protein
MIINNIGGYRAMIQRYKLILWGMGFGLMYTTMFIHVMIR